MPSKSKLSITIDEMGPIKRITTPPGEMLLEEFLKPLNMSANALALALRVPANRITAIINGERGITADTALRLGRYWGMSAEFWMNLQKSYELSKARMEHGEKIEREVLPREDIAEAA